MIKLNGEVALEMSDIISALVQPDLKWLQGLWPVFRACACVFMCECVWMNSDMEHHKNIIKH